MTGSFRGAHGDFRISESYSYPGQEGYVDLIVVQCSRNGDTVAARDDGLV